MKRIKNWILSGLLAVMLDGGALAADFQKGEDAYTAGDYATALAEFTPLAKAGDALAQYNLGKMYRFGYGVEKDDAEAMKWYRLAAEAGNAEAQISLGEMYKYGNGVPRDKAEAVKWYRLAAEAGNADGQYNLGRMHDSRLFNGGKDDAEAVKWYRLAAKAGHGGARYRLGLMYDWGWGVAQNKTEAMKWYRLAAETGEVGWLLFNQGAIYEHDEGDHEKAVKFYRLAAEAGYAAAQFNLGTMYDEGKGVPQNYAEAVKWYRLAAEAGDAKAQHNLGAMYANGTGAPQDYSLAYMWINLAAAQGNELAEMNRDKVANLMTFRPTCRSPKKCRGGVSRRTIRLLEKEEEHETDKKLDLGGLLAVVLAGGALAADFQKVWMPTTLAITQPHLPNGLP